ncbi:MAG: hypothetical protein AB8B69_08910 [Chitinophagales bacterium]
MKTFNIILATIIFSLLIAFSAQAQNFSSVSQFGGTYYGKLDGRNAKIKFEYLAYNVGFAEWTVTLTDLDRNVVMKGFAVEPRIAHGGDHIIHNVSVQTADKKIKKKFAKIMLHTWNTNYMTTFTDRGYGSVFARGNANNLPTPNPARGDRFNNVSQFYGSYVGRIDGRNASLKIARTPEGKVAYTLVDLDRNMTFKALTNSISVDDARPHAMRSIRLRSENGRKTKTIGGLYLHTWNTNYISGYDIWNGKEYGNFFVRQAATIYPVVKDQFKFKKPTIGTPQIKKGVRTNNNFKIRNR